MASVVPAEVSAAALDGFVAAVGAEHVLADAASLREFRDPFAFETWDDKRGLGPTPDQMFMRSNFGIVTKMGVGLFPEPECYMPLWLRAWRDDDLAAVVDTLRRLMLDGTIEHVPQIINTVLWASVLTKRELWHDGDGPIPDPVLDRMGRELEVGRWRMRFALYGDENVVDLRFEKIKAAFAHIEGVMDLAADQYSFNHAYRRFNETIKDALDPNGILSPGKQGIWPRRLRGSANGD